MTMKSSTTEDTEEEPEHTELPKNGDLRFSLWPQW